MKRFFLAVCFSLLSLSIAASRAEAKATAVSNAMEAQNKSRSLPTALEAPYNEYENMDAEELNEFLKERLKNAVITSLDDDSGALNGAAAVSMQQSAEYFQEQAEQNKSTFEKIYENALRRIDEQSGLHNKINFTPGETERQRLEQKRQWQQPKPDFAVMDILLPPDNNKAVVPALEHIPYWHSRIEILPSGIVNIDETIMVIANGEKLKHGLSRALPRFVVSRDGEKRQSDFTLNSVTINDRPVEYTLTASPDLVLITPKYEFNLEPGVYTFKFNYVVDRQIFSYNDYDELYWNVTGSSANLVIARAGATIILPPGSQALNQTAFTGYAASLSSENVLMRQEAPNITGFIVTEPLFLGEGLYMIADLPKDMFSEVDLTSHFLWFITDYGDIIFTSLALCLILLGYYISWHQMKKNPEKIGTALPKNPGLMRYLDRGLFDRTSFGGFLLELFKKNIIDIQKNDGIISLIKKTDNLRSLNKSEQNAVNRLFINNEPVLYINDGNLLKLKRAYKIIEQQTLRQFKLLSLRLNIGYLLFSLAMLLAAEGAAAFLQINSREVFYLLAGSTLFTAFCITLFNLPFKSRWISWPVKTVSSVLIFIAFCLMCLAVNPWAALAIFVSLLVIQFFTQRYSRRNGLLKGCIIEVENYKKHLLQHKENIVRGREFLNRQPLILALDLSDDFPPNEQIKDFYRLDIIKEIDRKL